MNRPTKESLSAVSHLQPQLDALPQAIRDRIAHIDFTLLFKGQAVRADLTDRFNIVATQATKDFTLYRQLAPNNITYDPQLRIHKRAANFSALFDYDVVRTLATLSQGYGDGFAGKINSSLACEAPYQLNNPSLAIVAKVTEAIHNNKPLRIHYISLSSGETVREIVPHTLVDNGLRWHVRAFDRQHNQFRDFVLTRITSAQVLENAELIATEQISQDQQWNQLVTLELVPHPRITYSRAIELDYGMVGGVLNVEIRAAIAGYLLRLWNVDCSKQSSLTGAEYQLWLRNSQPLSGMTNLTIAPTSTD